MSLVDQGSPKIQTPGLPQCEAFTLTPALTQMLGADWIEQELHSFDCGDQRLKQRCQTIMKDFYARPMATIPQACGSASAANATYEFFQHPHVEPSAILSSHGLQTRKRMAEVPVVLAVQDTTSFNHSTHRATAGLGPIGSEADKTRGFFLHSTVAFTPQRVPLGIVQAQSWARDPAEFGKKKTRHQRPIEDKESYKWLQSLKECQQLQAQLPQTLVVNIGDRESDIFELFQLARQQPQGPHLLVRAEHDRQLLAPEELSLWDFLATQPLAGHSWAEVRQTPKQPAREALLEVRYAEVTLKPPQHLGKVASLTLWAVWAQEIEAPAGAEPLAWMLLTTLPVTTWPQALEKIEWYCVRWEIEVFHKILKSGCQEEDCQLKSFDQLDRRLAIDLIVAWRIHLLTKLGREVPSLPASTVFSPEEWQALYCFIHKTSQPPDQEPTLKEAIRMVAKLGGFLGRKHDRDPGTITLWRGLHRLHDIALAWVLFHPDRPPP